MDKVELHVYRKLAPYSLMTVTAQYHCIKIHVPCITILVDQEIITEILTQTRHCNDYLVEILGDHTDYSIIIPLKSNKLLCSARWTH